MDWFGVFEDGEKGARRREEEGRRGERERIKQQGRRVVVVVVVDLGERGWIERGLAHAPSYGSNAPIEQRKTIHIIIFVASRARGRASEVSGRGEWTGSVAEIGISPRNKMRRRKRKKNKKTMNVPFFSCTARHALFLFSTPSTLAREECHVISVLAGVTDEAERESCSLSRGGVFRSADDNSSTSSTKMESEVSQLFSPSLTHFSLSSAAPFLRRVRDQQEE